jgi:hypothetical protein
MAGAGSRRRRRALGALALACASVVVVAMVTTVDGVALEQPPEPSADSADAGKYRPVADAAVTDVAAVLGLAPLTKPPIIETLPKKLAGGGQYAHEWWYAETGTCLIQLQPAAGGLDATDVAFVFAHEVVHCYQDRETGDAEVTGWVEEGAAMWVGAKVAPGSEVAKEKWDPYLTNPAKSLYGRTYDAVGFFGHLEHVGVDVGPLVPAMMKAATDDAAFTVATAADARTLDDWASGLARQDAFGAAWTTGGPDMPATKPPRTARTVSNGGAAGLEVARAATALAALDVKADVVTIDPGTGSRGRVRDAAGVDTLLVSIAGRPRCARAGGCTCPAGTAGAAVTLEAMAPGEALLGVTGGTQATKVSVAGRSLESFCVKPAKVDPCIVGSWVGEGVTIDLPSIELAGAGGQGAVLRFEKDGSGSVDMDPSVSVEASLPGGLVGSFKFSGGASGIVTASKGVMTTLAVTGSTMTASIDVPPLGSQLLPLGGSTSGAPFDGTYTCDATTLTYAAPGFGGQSAWTRSS